MSRSWGGCALGPLFFVHFLLVGVTSSREEDEDYSRTQAGDMTFRWLFWHHRAAGSWFFFFYLQLWVRFQTDSAHARVLARSVPCVCVCVSWCSLCLINVRKLGHVVCKEARSNYGEAPLSGCLVPATCQPPHSLHPPENSGLESGRSVWQRHKDSSRVVHSLLVGLSIFRTVALMGEE